MKYRSLKIRLLFIVGRIIDSGRRKRGIFLQAVAQQQIFIYWKMGTSNYPKTDHSIESVIIVKNNISGFTLDKDFPHSLQCVFHET